jgi:hypothetical protein
MCNLVCLSRFVVKHFERGLKLTIQLRPVVDDRIVVGAQPNLSAHATMWRETGA